MHGYRAIESSARLRVMARTWVLDTETKGTGAHVAPLEKATPRRSPKSDLNLVQFKRPVAPRAAPESDAPAPRRFKVVDLMTRETLAEHADARTTIDLLGQVRSVVDVNVYVWNPRRQGWRLLGFDEKRALWDFRDQRALESDAA
jgi:hypothetical protein